MCPKHLCHNIEDFSIFNLHFDLEIVAFIIKFALAFCIFNSYSLSFKLLVLITLEFQKRQNVSFSNKQEKPDLFKHEIEIKFRLNNSKIKVFSKIKIKLESKVSSNVIID